MANARLAELGIYKKHGTKNKVYYVNRMKFSFSFRKIDESGKPIPRVNPNTGMPITNSRGVPEFVEESIDFKPWRTRFTDLGYWCTYEVTPDTDPLLAKELEDMAKSRKSEVMSEKAFVEYTNPYLGEQWGELEKTKEELETLKKERDDLKRAKSVADEELAKIKQRSMNR